MDLEKVKEIRKRTGCGFSDGKDALVKADWDIEKACDLLKKKGLKVYEKRKDSEVNEGIVRAGINCSGDFGFVVSLKCETDFASGSADFIESFNKIFRVAQERKFETGEDFKNVDIVSDEVCSLIGKIKEKICVEYEAFCGENICIYNHHDKKMSSLVDFSKCDRSEFFISKVGNIVAMHVAAMSPRVVKSEDLGSDLLNEKIEEAKNELGEKLNGKSEDVKKKMIDGKLQKCFEEFVLLDQKIFVDEKKTVEEWLKEKSKEGGAEYSVRKFKVVKLGN